jgi:hypothetical protein
VISLWDAGVQDSLLARIGRLEPGTTPRWGRMTCAQMVVHLTDAYALYTGELQVGRKKTPLEWTPLKQLFIYVIPIPKNVPTARELITRVPGEWSVEVARLEETVKSFAAQRSRTAWPPHPLFGRMSRRACGVLAYRHTDHHLRQFGV